MYAPSPRCGSYKTRCKTKISLTVGDGVYSFIYLCIYLKCIYVFMYLFIHLFTYIIHLFIFGWKGLVSSRGAADACGGRIT